MMLRFRPELFQTELEHAPQHTEADDIIGALCAI